LLTISALLYMRIACLAMSFCNISNNCFNLTQAFGLRRLSIS
jgi:hypothetical protein